MTPGCPGQLCLPGRGGEATPLAVSPQKGLGTGMVGVCWAPSQVGSWGRGWAALLPSVLVPPAQTEAGSDTGKNWRSLGYLGTRHVALSCHQGCGTKIVKSALKKLQMIYVMYECVSK